MEGVGGTEPQSPTSNRASKGKERVVHFDDREEVFGDTEFEDENGESEIEEHLGEFDPSLMATSTTASGNEQEATSSRADLARTFTPTSTTSTTPGGRTRQRVAESRPIPVGRAASIWEENWEGHYQDCPVWCEKFEAALGFVNDWPTGIKKFGDKMYFEEKLCVPTSLQNWLIREHHSFQGHVGFTRQWPNMSVRYAWADEAQAKEFTKKVMGQCQTCQACSRAVSLESAVEPTPIPPAVMQSVAIDLFSMPLVRFEGQTFDTMVVCVDRHSGWIVAVPCLGKGLTGQKVAKLMMRHQWRLFGVPSVITSDQGSHFVSGWWQTLCALQGTRIAYSHAYHHQANGRAERAGQQIMEVARKLQVEEGITWVESLPQVIDRIHDSPGESGLSPYEILFGRFRLMGGLPYEPARECEDAVDFFKRQRRVDELVAGKLNALHQRDSARLNQERKRMPPLHRCDAVWYLRPPDAGNKMDSRWLGPCLVLEREGESSYVIEVKEGYRTKAHRRQLKPYQSDEQSSHGIEMFYHKRTMPIPDAPPDTWLTEKVVDHKRDADGKLWFLTKWQGDEETTWEPVGNFFHQYSADLINYCRAKGVTLDLSKCLSARAH